MEGGMSRGITVNGEPANSVAPIPDVWQLVLSKILVWRGSLSLMYIMASLMVLVMP